MRLVDFNARNEQQWSLTGLIAASTIAIFSLVGRSDPLSDAFYLSLECLAVSLPFLCLALWAFTAQDQDRNIGAVLAFAFSVSILVGYIGSFIGLAALIWGLSKTAGILFLVASVIAFGVASWINLER
jgi:hypothetical protein